MAIIGLLLALNWFVAAVSTQPRAKDKMPEQTIQVGSKTYVVAFRRKSKTVWIATGIYMGQIIEARGRNEKLAASAWRLASRYRRP
jgi:hypothetical protein